MWGLSQAQSLASPELNRETETCHNHHYPSLGGLGRLEKYVHLGVPMSVCGPLTVPKRGGVCVCVFLFKFSPTGKKTQGPRHSGLRVESHRKGLMEKLKSQGSSSGREISPDT